jgi:predicted kinase
MAHLIFLIGIPGSGKSFVAQELVKQCGDRQLIATDTIRGELFGDEAFQGSWPLIWQEIDRQFRQVVNRQRVNISSRNGKKFIHLVRSSAIYDATNAVRCHRQEAIALSKTTGFSQITGLWLDMPLSLCLDRNRQRHRQVPEEIIVQMHRQLTDAPPTLAEGFDRLIHWSAIGLQEI